MGLTGLMLANAIASERKAAMKKARDEEYRKASPAKRKQMDEAEKKKKRDQKIIMWVGIGVVGVVFLSFVFTTIKSSRQYFKNVKLEKAKAAAASAIATMTAAKAAAASTMTTMTAAMTAAIKK